MTQLYVRLCFVLLTLTGFLATTTQAAESDRPPSQIVVEAGWGRPYGELAQDFNTTELGLGAGDGLELGFRWRYHLSRTVSLSPAFHFMDYRNLKGDDSLAGAFQISSSSLRYTIELMFIQGNEKKLVRPFLALSTGLYRNRLVGSSKDLTEPLDQSVNTLGFGGRSGVRLGRFELSAGYHLNRFSTWQYFQTGQKEDYNWDNFSVRAGWVIPFSDGPPKKTPATTKK